ncbi:MAG: SUF system NifU family Fe-S cluster assembly protein [Bacilli bacterium]|nr:SUF system NifU family Fe-S cluster assembly protein [Bacilli bacterium]
MDPEVKREIIMDNYLNPKNKIRIEDSSYDKVNSNNESCIDNIDIFVKVTDDIIEDIKFDGEACAISTSSTSIMINNLIGLNISEAIKYIDNFDNMVNEKDYDRELLNEAIVYEDIYKQNNRKHCALLPYIGIRKVLEKYSK